MAFEPVGQKASYTDEAQFEFKDKGDELEGHYLGSETFKSKRGHMCTKHRVISEGSVFGFLGGKVLNENLSEVKPGTMIRVTFLGDKTGKNGNTYAAFKVEQDRSNVINIATATASLTKAAIA